MTSKTIKIDSATAKEVLIFLNKENGDYFVMLLCWHDSDDGLFIQQSKVDVCESNTTEIDLKMMQQYIADFSKESAEIFANSMMFD